MVVWGGAGGEGKVRATARRVWWVAALAMLAPSVALAAEDALEALLAPIMERQGLLTATVGVEVVRVSDGEVVFERGATRALLPASTMKVVTAAAALRALGPSFTFRTDVLTTGEVKAGTLEGDLVLVGRGDPTLVHERLWKLLSDVRQDGIQRISGDLIVDDTYFVGDPLIPGWDSKHDLETGPSYFPAIGAVAIDFGSLTLVVRPGAEVGKAASVELATPQSGHVSIASALQTGREGSRARVEITREVEPGKITFELEGSVPMGSDVRRYRRAITEPTPYFLAVLRAVAEQAGLTVKGRVRAGAAPADAELLRSLESPPLTSVLMDANKYSSNFMAETVLRALGAEAQGEGSNSAGVRQVRAYLESIGVARDDVAIANGSGLSRQTTLTPQALIAVLLDMARDRVAGPEFVSSLSIAGKDGTLSSRLRDTDGRVRGKTGTLGGVHTVAGYVLALDGELYAYAFLVNDIRGSLDPVKDLQDDFLAVLAAWGGS